MVTDPGIKITFVSWIHDYMKEVHMDLIFEIYLFILTVPLTAQYLAFYAILAIANIHVTRFNIFTLEMMRGE